MSNSADASAANTDQAAAQKNEDNATAALGAYQGDVSNYLSNVNSKLAEGNPFESRDYQEKQNLTTSGAMDSANNAEKAALGATAARTGTNTAALADTVASSARQGQRDLTQYNAGQNAANERSWLQEQNDLTKDQLAGATSEESIYGASTGAQSSDLGSMTQAAEAEDQMWSNIAGSAMQGAGTGLGAAFSG